MPSVKVTDTRKGSVSGARHNELWKVLGEYNLSALKIKDAHLAYYVIVEHEDLEKFLDLDTRVELVSKHEFNVWTPPEVEALRTIVAKHLDRQIDEFNEQEIKENLNNANPWLTVEEVIKLPTTSKIIKIKVSCIEEAERALRQGIKVLNQSIPPSQLEQETFIKLTPCFNCFAYDHKTNDCTKEKKTLCTRCAKEDHRADHCHTDEPRCINCGGPHRTLAARCPIRKKIIKEKAVAARKRERSRSQSARRSYAAAAATPAQTAAAEKRLPTTRPPPLDLPPNYQVIIASAIALALQMEAMNKGSFQYWVDRVYDLNGLPRVPMPTDIDVRPGDFDNTRRDSTWTKPAEETEIEDTQEEDDPETDMATDDYQKRPREDSTEGAKPKRCKHKKKKKKSSPGGDRGAKPKATSQQKVDEEEGEKETRSDPLESDEAIMRTPVVTSRRMEVSEEVKRDNEWLQKLDGQFRILYPAHLTKQRYNKKDLTVLFLRGELLSENRSKMTSRDIYDNLKELYNKETLNYELIDCLEVEDKKFNYLKQKREEKYTARKSSTTMDI